LTGVKLSDVSSLQTAIRILHQEFKVPHVVMSSMPLEAFIRNALPKDLVAHIERERSSGSTGHLICLASSRKLDTSDGEQLSIVHAHVLPCIPGYFSGVGDLFSSLVLAQFEQSSDASSLDTTPLSRAASLALSKTFALLRLTHRLCTLPGDGEEGSLATDEERDKQDPERRVRRMKRRELRLIEGQNLLRTEPSLPRNDRPDIDEKDEDDHRVVLRELRPWTTFWSQTQ
jgi:pyridoxine kinase